MSTSNPAVLFKKPVDDGQLPMAGEHLVYDDTRSIDLESIPLNGGFLSETVLVTPESVMRLRMRHREHADFVTTYNLDEPLVSFGVVRVLRSEKEGVNPGDYMVGYTPWQQYTVQPYAEGRVDFKSEEWKARVLDIDSHLSLRIVPDPNGVYSLAQYVSALGAPGMCAYCSLKGLAQVKQGDTRTLFVSAGASSVGLLVIQLAKESGLKVIASAGSESKLEMMRSLGADCVFNYKTEGYDKPLAKYGPLDIVYDNVGAEALEAAIEHTSFQALVICGGTSADYGVHPSQRYGIKNMEHVFQKALRITGLFVTALMKDLGDAYFTEMPKLLAEGKLRSDILRIDGLKNAPQATVDMLTGNGGNVGKPVVFFS